ncbi:MAG: hypothetical protein H6736_10645 [Alphaproteobacteria bacterium]|nr:hypothetical protein [Alphaproteobacteria bacterium]
MRLPIEARFGLAVLAALQLLTSAAGIALLARMSPAVEEILTQNVYSTEAVEAMLGARVLHDEPGFTTALERARGNITEPEETELLARIERAHAAEAAPGGEERLVADLHTLGEVNRLSMVRADERARSLGLAGAWAMALLGVAGFGVTLAVYRRMERRLLATVVEVDAVLEAARQGDRMRRCVPVSRLEHEHRLAANLNWLLERAEREGGFREDPAVRATLLALVDGEEAPVAVGVEEQVVALNAAALDLAAAPGRWDALVGALLAGEAREGWTLTRLARQGWRVTGTPGLRP